MRERGCQLRHQSAVAPSSSSAKWSRRPAATSSIVPTRMGVHRAHERVGLDVELEDVAVATPRRPVDVAGEARVVGLGRREGGEVVGADEGLARRLGARLVDAMRPPGARGRART